MKAIQTVIVCAFVTVALGCGPDTGMIDPPTRGDGTEPSLASRHFSDWSPPVNLGSVVNSSFGENAPEISKDGLTLYFASNRPGGLGVQDLYVSRRTSLEAVWGPPVNLGPPVNTPFQDTGPHLSRDGYQLFFNSSRPGGFGSIDVWVSRRQNLDDDLAWEEPVNLGSPPNSALFDGGVSIWRPEFYFWRGTPNPLTAPTDGDIYMSEITDEGFSDPTLVPELSSDEHDQRPSIRFDGREIYLSSDRPGGLGLEDIWVSLRQGKGHMWEPPANVGSVVNSDSRDTQAALSEDGTVLFFLSDRLGGLGNLDIYVTTRTRR